MKDKLPSSFRKPDGLQIRGGVECSQLNDRLVTFIEDAIATGRLPADVSITRHLSACSRCSQVYVNLLDVVSAPQITALQEGALDPERSPAYPEALLELWEMQLESCERLGDAKGSAIGLSVIGMIRRQMGDLEEAEMVHRLAIRTVDEGRELHSKVISLADLGYIAFSRGFWKDAVRQFEQGLAYAQRLHDLESQARILILLGETELRAGHWMRAQLKYSAAAKAAESVGYSCVADLARHKETALPPGGGGGDRSSDTASDHVVRHVFGDPRSGSPPTVPVFDTSPGEAVIVNTAAALAVTFIREPQVSRDGNLVTTMRLDPAGMNGIPHNFFLDVVVGPSNEVINRTLVGPQERLSLLSRSGLDVKAKLPHFERYSDHEAFANRESMNLPQEAFQLRIWWD